MKKKVLFICFILLIGLLAACGNKEKDSNTEEELPMLEVEFDVPETADPGETVKLTADVTYDNKPVEDATEVLFEIWETGHEKDSEKIEAKNEGDGTYTLEYTFETDGIYEMYAHTTAEGMHTMPKKQIIVGDAEAEEHESHEHGDDEHHGFHTEGFGLHFMEPEDVKADEETMLMAHITLDDEPLEGLKVRYEIKSADNEEDVHWADAEEREPGEYTGSFTFEEAGNYEVVVHVEDDDDLHEHAEYALTVE